jgi:hypothetical protein
VNVFTVFVILSSKILNEHQITIMPERFTISQNVQILASILVGSVSGILTRLVINKIKSKSQKESEDISEM